MILISHRGNINGPNDIKENSPYYIMEAISEGFDVEVDVWYVDNQFWLGHDSPQYRIDYKFLLNEKLWCHAKNINALMEMKKYAIHYFWHENDTVTLTSKNYVWAYPNKEYPTGVIAVLPEMFSSNIDKCKGVCSDFVINFK